MRRRSIFAASVVVVAVGAATAVLVARNDEPAPRQPTTTTTVNDPGYIGRYAITVTDPAGNTQEATFQCGGHNPTSGYLTLGDTYEACRTAIADFDIVDYLGTGKRPPTDCAAVQQITHAGWHYLITGDALGPGDRYAPVHEELTVKTACDEALWQHMKALFPKS